MNPMGNINEKVDPSGFKYLKWARAKRLQMESLRVDLGIPAVTKHFEMADGILVSIRAAAEDSFIRISGCTDTKGFLLIKDFGYPEAPYKASYVNGTEKRILSDGKSRADVPGLPPEEKVLRYTLPTELAANPTVDQNTPSRYSGIMRRVVGCYHSAGKNAPFNFRWGLTHGIAKVTVTAPGVVPKDHYWLIEVASAGVFAMPINGSGKCCDSWGVVKAQPTAAMIAENSNLTQYKNQVNLQWAMANRPNAKVVQLLTSTQMAPAYNYSPFVVQHGWAFNYSGTQAAHVVGEFVDVVGADDYYEMRLATLDFSHTVDGDGKVSLSAALSVGTPGKVVFKRSSFGTLWVPGDDIQTWDGVLPPAGSAAVGEGPVHVFYDGDQQILVNWGQQITSVAAVMEVDDISYLENGNPDPDWNASDWDGNATGAHTIGGFPVNTPIVQEADCFKTWRPALLSSGRNNAAYTNTNYGFSGVFDLKLDQYSRSTKESASAWNGAEYQVSSTDFFNSYSLCGGGTGSATIREIVYDRDVMKTRDELSESQSGSSVLVLFGQEREAVAGYRVVNYSATGTRFFVSSKHRYRQTETRIGGAGPFTDIEYDNLTWRGGNTTPPSEPLSTTTSSAEYHFAGSGGIRYTAAIPDINLSADLSPFLVFDVGTKETASSGLYFMRGNLYDADESLDPPDQKGNHAYKRDDPVFLSPNFAPLDGAIVSFVGKA